MNNTGRERGGRARGRAAMRAAFKEREKALEGNS